MDGKIRSNWVKNAGLTWSGWPVPSTGGTRREGEVLKDRNGTRMLEGLTGQFRMFGPCSLRCGAGIGQRHWNTVGQHWR